MSIQHEQKINKIVSVVGPTASGKTHFALKIAQQALNALNEIRFSGIDIISVDSRQVYKGLEILTGADIPNGFEQVAAHGNFEFPYFRNTSLPISLHGISIIDFKQEWSVAHFKDFATKIILNSFENNRLPILVGGTGLYHQYLFSSDSNLYVPPNARVRKAAVHLGLNELQHWLEKVAAKKLAEMNNSDRNNPRRLVRAIEIALGAPNTTQTLSLPANHWREMYGMNVPLEQLQSNIVLRVKERFRNGAITEVKTLLQACEKQDLPICSTLGVGDISDFLSGKSSEKECQENWALHEFQYAKRQLTWFQKQKDIIWLDDLQKKQYTFR
ncbi:MAG: tRNA dimethylallyltransferase [Patescibacteria group bacterium]|nr:MAG: tRNA dimethylallyltransferase [Patescibacteria group bacterium]